MKKILVTGAAGFLGSHLCEALLEKGHKVIGVDNFYTGKKDNLSKCFNSQNFVFFEHDIIEEFPSSIALHDIDFIFNLACPASPVHYQKDPICTLKTSVWGIQNVLTLAENKKAGLLHASTSEVYGDPLVHPQHENYLGNVNTLGPRACYDEGKRCAETLIYCYHLNKRVDAKIVRIFNTYGPHMDANDGRVVSNFIIQALRGEDITIYGEGNQTRSFCYVSDLVKGIIKYSELEKSFLGPINLGNPGEFTILELANRILEMTTSNSKLCYKPLPKDDPTKRRPVIDVAKETLNWQPEIPLHEGLVATIEYFKKINCEVNL